MRVASALLFTIVSITSACVGSIIEYSDEASTDDPSGDGEPTEESGTGDGDGDPSGGDGDGEPGDGDGDGDGDPSGGDGDGDSDCVDKCRSEERRVGKE